jgi:hypothetical protein
MSTTTGREHDRLAAEAKRILKAEMERREYSFKQLAQALEADGGTAETIQTLINKVNRGRFSFAFFLRAVRAMGVATVNVGEVEGLPAPGSATTRKRRSPARRTEGSSDGGS